MIPAPATKLREVYDLFMENKGKPVRFSTTGQRNKRALDTLQTYYGLQIDNLQDCIWILRGEWIDANFVNYEAVPGALAKLTAA